MYLSAGISITITIYCNGYICSCSDETNVSITIEGDADTTISPEMQSRGPDGDLRGAVFCDAGQWAAVKWPAVQKEDIDADTCIAEAQDIYVCKHTSR